MPASSLDLHVRRCGRALHRHCGQLGQLRIGEPVHGPGQLVLGGQPGAEQQRVVGTERHRDPGVEQLRQRHRGWRSRDAERHIRGRADLKRGLPVGQPPQQLRILDGPDPVPDPVGVQLVQAGTDAGRSLEFAAVRHQHQPGPGRDPERRGEVGRSAASFVVRQAEAGHAAPGVAPRQPGRRPGFERVPDAVRGDDHSDADAGRPLGLRDRVEYQLRERRQAPEHGGVPGRVDLELKPARAFGSLILRQLGDQPADISGLAQHRPGDVVQPLEPEPAPLIGAAQPGRPVAAERVGQPDPVLARQARSRSPGASSR